MEKDEKELQNIRNEMRNGSNEMRLHEKSHENEIRVTFGWSTNPIVMVKTHR